MGIFCFLLMVMARALRMDAKTGSKKSDWMKGVLERLLDAIHLHCPGQTLHPMRVAGPLAKKVLLVSPRGLHFSRTAVVLPEEVDEAYTRYIGQLYNGCCLVLAPQPGYSGGEINLVLMAAGDFSLRALLRGESMSSYVVSKQVRVLSDTAGARLIGPDSSVQGFVDAGGNKFLIQTVFRGADLRVPVGSMQTGATSVCLRAQQMLDAEGAVYLRHVCGDGGLGNVPIRASELKEEQTVEQYLRELFEDPNRAEVKNLEEWCSHGVLVERYHHVVGSPAAMLHIDEHGVARLVDVHDQITNAAGDCLGIAYDPDCRLVQQRYGRKLFKLMQTAGIKVAQHFAAQGVRDTFLSVDFIVTQDYGDELQLRGTEVNLRMTATCVNLFIGHRLGVLDQPNLTNDQMPLKPNMSFTEVLRQLENSGLLWNPERGVGVVVTIPPTPYDTIGIWCSAPDLEGVRRVYARVQALIGPSD